MRRNFKTSVNDIGERKITTALNAIDCQVKQAIRNKNQDDFIDLLHQDIREVAKSTKKRKRTSSISKKKNKKAKLAAEIPPKSKNQKANESMHNKKQQKLSFKNITQNSPRRSVNLDLSPSMASISDINPPILQNPSNNINKKAPTSRSKFKNLFTQKKLFSQLPTKPANQKSLTKKPLRSFTKMPTKTYTPITASKQYSTTSYFTPSQSTTKHDRYLSSLKKPLPEATLAKSPSTTQTQKSTNFPPINPNDNNIIINRVQIMNPINVPSPSFKIGIPNSKPMKTPIITPKQKPLRQNLASPVLSKTHDSSKTKIKFNGKNLYSTLKHQANNKTNPSSFPNFFKQIANIFPELKREATTSHKTPDPSASKTRLNSPFKTPNLLSSNLNSVTSDDLLPNHSHNQPNHRTYTNNQTPQNSSNKQKLSLNLKSIFNPNKPNSFTFPQPVKKTSNEKQSKLHQMHMSGKIISLMKSMQKTIQHQEKLISKKDQKIAQLSKKVEKLEQVSIKKVKLTTSRACKTIENNIENATLNQTGIAAIKRLFVKITKSNLFKIEKLNEVETDGRLLSVGARGGSKLWLEITNRNQKTLNNKFICDETLRKLENELYKIIQFLGLNERNLIKILEKNFDTRIDGPIKFPSHKLWKCWAVLPIPSKKLLRRFINLVKKEEPSINLGSINCLANYEKELTLESAVSEQITFLIKTPTDKNELETNLYEDRPYYHANAIEVVTQILNLGYKYKQITHHPMLPSNQLTFIIKSDKFGGGTETIISCINKKKPNSAQTSVILEYFKAPDKISNMEITLKKNNKENLKKLFYHTTILTLLIPNSENEPQKISVLLINDKDTKNLELKEWVFKSMLFYQNENVEDEFPNGFFTTHLFM